MSLHNWRMIFAFRKLVCFAIQTTNTTVVLENTGYLIMHPQKHEQASTSPTLVVNNSKPYPSLNKFTINDGYTVYTNHQIMGGLLLLHYHYVIFVICPTREAVASCRDLHSEISFFSGLKDNSMDSKGRYRKCNQWPRLSKVSGLP